MKKCILDDICEHVGRFVIYPSEHAKVMHTLWIAHTHLIEAFDYTPRLCVLSAEKRSGKSTLVKLTKILSQKGYAFVNPSPASIYSIIEERKPIRPALCIDEQDRLWEKKETAEITAILDQGFERDNDGVPRVTIDSKNIRRVEMFNTFCPVLLAGIENGNIPETILDRSIVIRMKRRAAEENVERYRTRHKAEGNELRQKLEQWGAENIEAARSLTPDMPKTLDDRYADICEPLFIVSDVTNVTVWKDRARNAALWFCDQRIEDEPSTGIKFLRDVQEKFAGIDRLFKSDLEQKIYIDRNEFNKLRRKFDIPKDHTIRIVDKVDKGWYRSDWLDVWSRYLVTDYTPVTTDTIVTTDTNKEVELTNSFGPEECERTIKELRQSMKKDSVTYEEYQTRRKYLGMPYNADVVDKIA